MSHVLIPLPGEEPDALSTWLRQQHLAADPGHRGGLFALIDLARLTADQRAELPVSVTTVMQHRSTNLYADLEGSALADAGPRLCTVSDDALADWVVVACQTQLVSFMAGAVEQNDLAGHLQSLREVTLPDGSQALFRFQDCHVCAHLWPMLTPGLANQMLGPLLWWATPDTCGPWHLLTQVPGHRRAGALRFDRFTYDRLNEELLVYTLADQVREVDAALLEGMNRCQSRRLLQARLNAAKGLGLTLQSDLALYVVLSLQLPEGFERSEPFASALESNRQGHQTFGVALDRAPAYQWNRWNDELAND